MKWQAFLLYASYGVFEHDSNKNQLKKLKNNNLLLMLKYGKCSKYVKIRSFIYFGMNRLQNPEFWRRFIPKYINDLIFTYFEHLPYYNMCRWLLFSQLFSTDSYDRLLHKKTSNPICTNKMAKFHYLPPTSTYLFEYTMLPPPTNEPRGQWILGENVPAAPKFGENLHIFCYNAKYMRLIPWKFFFKDTAPAASISNCLDPGSGNATTRHRPRVWNGLSWNDPVQSESTSHWS